MSFENVCTSVKDIDSFDVYDIHNSCVRLFRKNIKLSDSAIVCDMCYYAKDGVHTFCCSFASPFRNVTVR
jgi:hypothetical protein